MKQLFSSLIVLVAFNSAMAGMSDEKLAVQNSRVVLAVMSSVGQEYNQTCEIQSINIKDSWFELKTICISNPGSGDGAENSKIKMAGIVMNGAVSVLQISIMP